MTRMDDDSELEEKPKAKPTKKKPAAKGKEKADKPASRAPKRAPATPARREKPAAKRESRRDDEPKSVGAEVAWPDPEAAGREVDCPTRRRSGI